MSTATPWHLTPAALSIIASIDRRPEVELVRDLLSPSGDARQCYVGDAVDALTKVFVTLTSVPASVFPEDVLAALFGPADPSRVFADDKVRWAALECEISVALKPLQVAA